MPTFPEILNLDPLENVKKNDFCIDSSRRIGASFLAVFLSNTQLFFGAKKQKKWKKTLKAHLNIDQQ